jgi:microcystin-dependent protein
VTPFDPSDPLGRNNLASWNPDMLWNFVRERLSQLPDNTRALINQAVSGVGTQLVQPGAVFFFPFDDAPEGYLPATGGIYNIADYPALGALLAPYVARYGGDGTTTFGVPDLRGRVPVGVGPNGDVSAVGRTELLTALADRSPQHKHGNSHVHSMQDHTHDVAGNTNTNSASTAVADAPHQHTYDDSGTTKTTNNQNANETVTAHTHTHGAGTLATGAPTPGDTDTPDSLFTGEAGPAFQALLPAIKT